MTRFTLIFLFVSTFSFAQYKTLNPEKAAEYIKEGVDFYHYEEYEKAWSYFNKVDSSLFKTFEDLKIIGITALRTDRFEDARVFLYKANLQSHQNEKKPTIILDVYLHTHTSNSINFNIARAYNRTHELDKAIQFYTATEEEFKSAYGSKLSKYTDQLEVIKKYKAQCEVGKKLMSSPVEGVIIENLGENINSESSDFAPLITADEKYIIFTSRRSGSTGGEIASDGKYMEDIYMSKNVDGVWRRPWKISKKINSEAHDAGIGLSTDGSTLLIYRSDKGNSGNIYSSFLQGKLWSEPVKLPDGINSDGNENSASLSADGRLLVFTSDRPGGFGGFDIYMVQKQPDGQWGEAKNLGATINTPEDEEGPFLHADGRTMYFSSKGHETMGGFDIFKSLYDAGTGNFTQAVNVGYPINSANDDVFYVWTPDGRRAYFSTRREGGFGDQDLYKMTVPDAQAAVVLLKGEIRAKDSHMPIGAKVTIFDNDNNIEVASINTNDATGEYVLVVKPGQNYGISVEREGYVTYSDHIELPILDKYYEKEMNVDLERVESQNLTVLQNVFFELNKSELKKESHHELDLFVKLLQENINLDAEVVGHTEPGGLQENNLILSVERAQSVVDYLVSKGIAKERVIPKGYGAKFPVSFKKAEDLRSQNRRTEIILHDRVVEGVKWVPYYEK